MRSGHFLLACILTVALSSGMSPVPSPVELQPEGETPTSGSGTGELPVVGPDDNPLESREEAETLTDPDATMVDTDQSMSGDLEHLSYGPEEGVQPTEAEDAMTAQVLPQGSFADATPLIRGTQRASGGDRYATAVAISKRLFPNGKADSVFIASGTSYSDGLALGALAAYAGGPLLLTSAQSLPTVVHDEIQRLTPKTIYIGGGTGAVSASVERQLSLLSTEIVRLAGTDRYGTARAIAGEFPAGSPVAISTGTDFPDALVAASATPKLGVWTQVIARVANTNPGEVTLVANGTSPVVTGTGPLWIDNQRTLVGEAAPVLEVSTPGWGIGAISTDGDQVAVTATNENGEGAWILVWSMREQRLVAAVNALSAWAQTSISGDVLVWGNGTYGGDGSMFMWDAEGLGISNIGDAPGISIPYVNGRILAIPSLDDSGAVIWSFAKVP